MKLTERQRDNLVNDFQELERLSSVVESESEEDPQKSDEANLRERKTVNQEVKLQSLVQAYGRSVTPSRTKHAMAANIQKDNKSFWSSGVENHIKAPMVASQKHLISKPQQPQHEQPLYKVLGRPTKEITAEQKKELFHIQYQSFLSSQSHTPTAAGQADKGFSFKALMNSVFGLGASTETAKEEPAASGYAEKAYAMPPTSQHYRFETREASSFNKRNPFSRPKHSRFGHSPPK